MAWQQNNRGWRGEGKIKIFLDGDDEFPTICGTGTEDYFGGAWCFDEKFSAPFLGYPIGNCDGSPGNRHGLYRFHIPDPIRFASDIRVSPCRPLAGAAERAICRCRTISPRSRTGTRRCPPHPSHPCRTAMHSR